MVGEARVRVPRIPGSPRNAWGGAFVGRSARHWRGEVNCAWPTAEIAVMGAKGAVEIIFRGRTPAEIAERTAEY